MRGAHFFFGTALLALASASPWAADGVAQLQRLHEAERLNLENRQEQYRQKLKPLPPLQQQQLRMRLDQQRLDQWRLQQQQLQQRRALEQRLRLLPPDVSRTKQNQQLQQFQRQQQQQQLQLQMQRDSWPYPKQ